MRFIHTSDWHLGRVIHGVHLTDDQSYLLQQFIDIIQEEKPDAIIIAGDLYDRSIPPVEAVELLDDTFSRIILDLKIPVIAIAGNHDSADRVNFGSRLLQKQNLFLAGKLDFEFKPVTLYDKYGAVDFYTVPYTEPCALKQFFESSDLSHDESMRLIIEQIKKNKDKDHRSVLITHAFIAGCAESESERPLSVGGTGAVSCSYFKDFDYTALGHLHQPQKAGADNILYSGSLMKYSFSEANQKKCMYVIDMDETGKCNVKDIYLKPKRDLRCIEGYLKDLIDPSYESGGSKEDYLQVNLLDEGALLDPIGRLKKVFPNVLKIEREQFNQEGKKGFKTPGNDYNKLSDKELFMSFYAQAAGKKFDGSKEKVLEELLEEFRHSKEAENL